MDITKIITLGQNILKGAIDLAPIITTLISIYITHILKKNRINLEAKIEEGNKKNEELRKTVFLRSEEKELILYKYKVEACERLWKGVSSLAHLKGLASYLASLKEDKFEELKKQKNIKEFIEAIGQLNGVNIEEIEKSNEKKASKLDCEKIYLSEKLWALYLEYCRITSLVVLNFLYLKDGKEDLRKLYDYDGALSSIKKLMPEKFGNLRTISNVLLPDILSSYEEEMLKEIKNTLNGVEESKESIAKYKEIIKEIEKSKESLFNNFK